MLPVIHVGFHKCGSTTLQGALFQRHPQIANLGEPDEDPGALEAVRGVWQSCHPDPRKRSDFDADRSQALWQDALARIAPGKVPVFSKETLTLAEFYSEPGDDRIATKLHSVVGAARIVIVVRHQIGLIESLYLFHAKGSRWEPAEQWLRSRSDGPLRLYRYHTVAESFVKRFGRENVAVLLFEDLKADAAEFARQLCQFIGVDSEQGAALIRGERRNKRVSRRYLIYSKLRKGLGMYVPLGRIVPGPVREAFNNFVTAGEDAKVRLPDAWVREMESYYRDDNCRLAQEWSLPLGKYGYPI
ncbi:MAG: sulfotransferase [Candidatus Binatia bacterium]